MKPETTNRIRTICNTICIIVIIGCGIHISIYWFKSSELTEMQVFYDEIDVYLVIFASVLAIGFNELTRKLTKNN